MWLPLAEWWYNTNYHTSLRMSAFQALYVYIPPHLDFPSTATTSVAVVEEYLKQRDAVLDLLKESLHHAEERMKFYADNKRTNKTFEVGDHVYLKLRPYRQASLKKQIGARHLPSLTLPTLDTDGRILVIPATILALKLSLEMESRYLSCLSGGPMHHLRMLLGKMQGI
ncbi:uncharacterized protein LOC113343815 [Papaver somniferum]|uniref:uncharacterized protein LOC113343815 n=1 Tax=Papaver somniferum TaxID=3469 RepID=UPI000E6FF1F8|nr:uncharacterized protein LOC113343815 [Papaver somniferum]